MKVLVVDDKVVNLELVTQELEDEGIDVCTATSGRECYQVAKSAGVAVILLDWQMPGMDGLTTCKLLKSDPDTRDIPVIILTAHDPTPELREEAKRVGASDFITKPYNLSLLVTRLRSYRAAYRMKGHGRK